MSGGSDPARYHPLGLMPTSYFSVPDPPELAAAAAPFAVHLHRSKGVPYRPKKDKPPDPEVWGARDTQIEAGGGSPPFLGFINLRPDRFGGPLSGRPFYVPPWAVLEVWPAPGAPLREAVL